MTQQANLSIVDGFQAVVGRAATDDEKLRLYAYRDKLRIPDGDPMWPVLYINEDHHTRIRSLLIDVRDQITAAATGNPTLALDDLADRVATRVAAAGASSPQADAMLLELTRRSDYLTEAARKLPDHISTEAQSIRDEIETVIQMVERGADDDDLDPESSDPSSRASSTDHHSGPHRDDVDEATPFDRDNTAPDAPNTASFDLPFGGSDADLPFGGGDPEAAAPAAAAATPAAPPSAPAPTLARDGDLAQTPDHPTVAAAADDPPKVSTPLTAAAHALRAEAVNVIVQHPAVRAATSRSARIAISAVAGLLLLALGLWSGWALAVRGLANDYAERIAAIPVVRELGETATGREWIDFGRRQSLRSLDAIMTCDPQFGLSRRAATHVWLCGGGGPRAIYGWRVR